MANITVELPDGRIVDTGTDNAELAQSRIEEALRAERPLPGFFRSAVQGARGTFGSAVTGAGTIAGAVGLPGEQTLRGIGEAISGEEPQDTRNPELADFLTQPFATARALTGQGLGSIAAFLATGAGAGLLARTVFGLGARATGATAGAAGAQRAGTVAGTVGAGALASTGELEEGLLAEGVNPERARTLAASLGPLIGVAETANLAGLARRVLGREMTEETARQIAQRGMLSAMARTGGREAFLEALTEGGAETARQGVIAAETGNLNPEERFAAIALGTIAGGLAGGTIGAPGGLLERGAARRQIEALDAAREPPPPGPETEPPPAPDLGAPTPFTDEAAAREYLFGVSNAPETLRERMRVNPALTELEGQALINEANRIQTEDNLRAQRRIAQSIVDDLLLPQTTDPTTGERNVPPPDEYAREIVRSISAYNNNLTEDQQPISLTGGFRADDIVRAAFARAEQPVTEGPLFNAAAGRANELLKQLTDIGILQPRKQGNKTFYTLAEPNAEERAARTERGQAFAQAPQPAPPTPEQTAAAEALNILRRNVALSDKQLESELNKLEQTLTARQAPTDVVNLARALTDSLRQRTEETTQNLLDTLNARLPEDQQFAIDPEGDQERQAQSLRARAASQLEVLAGQQPATAMQDPQAIKMADSSRPDAAAIMAQESADTVEFFRQRAQEIGLEAAVNDPETAATLFSNVVGGNPNITNWSFKKVQNALRDDFGINVTPEQAGKIIRAGRDEGIVDNTFKVRRPGPSPEAQARTQNAMENQNLRAYLRTPQAREFIQSILNSQPLKQDWSPADFQQEMSSLLPFPVDAEAGTIASMVANSIRQEGQRAPEAQTAQEDRPSAAFTESDSEPNATFGDDREAGEPNFARREPEYALSDEYTEAEIQAAEQIFRQAVGPSARLQWAQNLRIENLRGNVRAFLERENADLPINQRITEISGYALGDLVVLSMARDNNWSITETAIHEGQHVAENIGLFSRQDLDLLNANSQAILAGIKDRVGQFEFGVASADPREMRAYGLNAYLRGARFNPVVNGIFGRIQRFMQRLANYLRGRGYQTVDDVYSRFLSGRMAAPALQTAGTNTGAYSPTDPRINFAAKPPPGARSATSGPILTPKETQNLGWWAQNFGSPTQAGKFNARYNPVSQVQQETVSAVNQVQMPAEKAIAPLYDLAPVDLAAATRAWSQANRAGQPVNTAGLSPKAADAVKQASDALQKIFDAAIEAYVQPFFNPANAKTPAEKAALDAMWAKHSGKTLLAIPDADLRAASPKGFKELSEFRGKRRPGYLPMMMSGSHYMAVYSKGPGGKRNLEKIVFFDPSTFVQRRFGQNEEAYFRQQLEKRYPDRTKFEITKAAPARTTDRRPEIQAILESRNAVNDFIQTFMDPSMNAATKQKIAESMKFLDKQQMGRLFRPFDDKLLAIHDRNESTYLLDALPQYIMGISKIVGYRQTDDAFRDSIANLSAQDQQHFKTLRTYGSMPTEAFGTLRSFQFFWLLGGAVDTAIINMLQPIQLTTPLLLRDGANIANVGSAYKDVSMGFDFFSSMKDAFTGKQTDLLARLKSRLRNADEVAAIEAADKAGVFTPLFTNESRGQFTVEAMRRMGAADPRKSAAKANRITGAMGSLMQTVEQYNRAVAFVAAYRAAKENPAIIQRANQLDNTNYQTAADYARGTVVSSQFLITKEDRALIQRAYPVMEVATQFMSYPIKAIEQMVLAANQSLRGMKDGDPVLVKAGAFSLLAQVVPLVMLAGVWALPLAEPLRELIELAWGNGLNLDQELRRLVGPDAAPFASRGVPHALGVANLSGRLALSPVDFNQLTEPTLLNLMGPTGSFIENVNLLDDNSPIRRYWQNGDWVGLSTVFTPRFVSNIIRGSSLAAGYDQFTRQGNAIVQAEEVRTGEALMVATGFPPPRFTNMRDMVNAIEEQNRQITQRSQRDNMRAAGYYTQILEANRDNNPQALARAQENLRAMMQEIAEHNARIYDLALVNEEEFRRQLPRLRQWNPNAIMRRAIANYYGISDEIPLTRMANQRVRPQMEDLRRLYNLQ